MERELSAKAESGIKARHKVTAIMQIPLLIILHLYCSFLFG
jgi:hypothetical protein